MRLTKCISSSNVRDPVKNKYTIIPIEWLKLFLFGGSLNVKGDWLPLINWRLIFRFLKSEKIGGSKI
jgi:hypothetical protein